MAIVLNFKDFSVSSGSGRDAVDSSEALGEVCTLTQLNRFAESILGERFEKGTRKAEACKQLYGGMVKQLGNTPPPDPDKFEQPKPPAQQQPSTTVKRIRKEKEKKTGKGYDAMVKSINEEYAEVLENLSLVKEYTNDYKGIVAKIKDDQKEKLDAVKSLKNYM